MAEDIQPVSDSDFDESVTPPLVLADRRAADHKGRYGRVRLIGGSRGMVGAIALSGIAALRTGSGLVSVAVPDRCLDAVAGFHPALMTVALPDDGQGRFASDAGERSGYESESVSAVGIGPGMTTVEGSVAIVRHWLARSTISRVLDADAINVLAKHSLASEIRGPVVLTPHPGELERLVGVPASERESQIAAAQTLSSRCGAVIVIKGGPTVVVDGRQRWTNQTGNPGMATAGSGDVLTGMITSLLGQGLSTWDAARLAVHHHGAAGDRAAERWGMAAMTALDLANEIRVDGPTP